MRRRRFRAYARRARARRRRRSGGRCRGGVLFPALAFVGACGDRGGAVDKHEVSRHGFGSSLLMGTAPGRGVSGRISHSASLPLRPRMSLSSASACVIGQRPALERPAALVVSHPDARDPGVLMGPQIDRHGVCRALTRAFGRAPWGMRRRHCGVLRRLFRRGRYAMAPMWWPYPRWRVTPAEAPACHRGRLWTGHQRTGRTRHTVISFEPEGAGPLALKMADVVGLDRDGRSVAWDARESGDALGVRRRRRLDAQDQAHAGQRRLLRAVVSRLSTNRVNRLPRSERRRENANPGHAKVTPFGSVQRPPPGARPRGRAARWPRPVRGQGDGAQGEIARSANPTSPTQREFCRFSLFSTTQVIELLESCTPNSPQYRL